MSDDAAMTPWTKRIDALMRPRSDGPRATGEVPVLTQIVSDERAPRRRRRRRRAARRWRASWSARCSSASAPRSTACIEERLARTLNTVLGQALDGVRAELTVSVTQMVREAVAASVALALRAEKAGVTRQELQPRGDRAALVPALGSARLFQAPRPTITPAYCIQLPPPNVTGTLHMGHAFQQTLMDALIRYHRMRGDNTNWVVGHRPRRHRHPDRGRAPARGAGQDAPRPRAREVHRARLGVEAAVRLDHHAPDAPPRRFGELDYADTEGQRAGYFTMDAKMSRAVVEVFVRLYEQGLIYRGKRLVNWDPVLRHRGVRPRGRHRGGRRHASGRSAIRSRTAAARIWSSRPRGRRRCSATWPWRCIRRTSATGIWSARSVRLPLTGRTHPGHRRRLRRPRVRHRLREDHARRTTSTTTRSASATASRRSAILTLDAKHERQRAGSNTAAWTASRRASACLPT